MKKICSAAAAVTLSAVTAQAGGLDRSDQPIGIIFEQGNVFEFSLGYSKPSVDGTDLATSGPTGGVADEFLIWGTAVKYDVNEKLSFALVIDEPYGTDVSYPVSATSLSLGGTRAVADSHAITGIARYKFNENWSIHGGLRHQTIGANVTLGGGAYLGLNGYNAAFASGSALGYLLGVAYERPDIALRVALTYNSEISHDLDTIESISGTIVGTGTTEVVAPQSLNLNFQTGIAANTLLFGSVRYAAYEDTIVSPTFFDGAVAPGTPGSSLTDIDDSLDLEIGIGRRFNEKWSGRIAIGYESDGDDNLVSPLAPTNGSKYVTVGAAYNVNDRLTISGGVRYTDLGDAFPETGTPDTARANFSGNSAWSAGLKFSFKF